MNTDLQITGLKSLDLKVFLVTIIYINIIIAPIKYLLKEEITPDILVIFVTIFVKYALMAKKIPDMKIMINPILTPPDYHQL